MKDVGDEDLIPGDKCEERLLADESQWKKEKVPPVAGPTSKGVSTLDISGSFENAEAFLHSTGIFDCGSPKKNVSVVNFFAIDQKNLMKIKAQQDALQ
jgi:hypothetical protein